MSGGVYVGGAGSEDDEKLLWDLLFEPGQHVVCWPYAQARRESRKAVHRWLSGALERRGAFRVETWADDGPIERLGEAQVLFIPGGNTFELLHHLRGRGWLGAVGDFVAGGGRLYGGSAGAILCGADIAIAGLADEDTVATTDTTGLDLLGGRVVHPHFRTADIPALQRWAREHDVTVLGVPERSGLVYRDGRIRAVGPEPVRVFTGR